MLSRELHMKEGDNTVSVIVPVRDEAENIREFCGRIKEVLENTGFQWEVIFIEDSSTDGTVELIHEICHKDDRFRAIFLTRNFGHHEAITAGIDFACGAHIITMDGDLQHPPEVIPTLLANYLPEIDMVCAKRREKEPLVKNIGSKLVNHLMTSLSDDPIALNSSGFRIFSRRIGDTVKSMHERRRFISGMLSWPGFRTKEIMFDEQPRRYGKTKYDFKKMVQLGLNAVTSFSVKPLRFAIYFGFLCSTFSFVIGIYYILTYFLIGITVQGFTAIIVAIFFMGGVILLVLGILGEYIGNIFIEVKARPLYVVEKTLNVDKRGN
jgi:glycosyltransferase involved in cell wall biosynthesis